MDSVQQNDKRNALDRLKGELALIEMRQEIWTADLLPELQAVRDFGAQIDDSKETTDDITELSKLRDRRKQIADEIGRLEEELGITPGFKPGDVVTFTFRGRRWLGYRIAEVDGDRLTVVAPDGARAFPGRSEMEVHSYNGRDWPR